MEMSRVIIAKENMALVLCDVLGVSFARAHTRHSVRIQEETDRRVSQKQHIRVATMATFNLLCWGFVST